MGARLSGSPPDAFRNHACPLYDNCLSVAAGHEPELDFSCRGCRHEADRQAVELDAGDVVGCIGLLLVVLADVDLPNIGGLLDAVAGRLGEMISTITGERPRPVDEPHWGRPGPE